MTPAENTQSNGFTLIELVIVMSCVAIILSVVMKSTRGMQQEAQITKVQGEISTLKSAVTSYWKNNGGTYPENITTALTSASPQILAESLIDPFNTDAVNNTYGYELGTDPTFGTYFCIYSQGPRGDTAAPAWDAANQRFTYTGSGAAVSNAPVIKLP